MMMGVETEPEVSGYPFECRRRYSDAQSQFSAFVPYFIAVTPPSGAPPMALIKR
jgi:hypothetical protein